MKEEANKTEKKEPKRVRKRDLEAKPALDEEALKNIINLKYSQFNDRYNIVKQAVDNLTEKLKRPILDLIDFVDDSLELVVTKDENGKRIYDMRFNLSEDELRFLAIKIPAACTYVQEFLNDKAIDVSLAEYILEDTVTENLKFIEGGDARERLRFAAQKAEVEQIVLLIKKQVYANLKSYIERADKVYDGVKKVLDGINRDKQIFGNRAVTRHSGVSL